MNPDQAGQLVEYAKGLFRYMTPAQGKILLDKLLPFPNPTFARQAIEHLATHKPADQEGWDEGNIPLVAITERLAADMRRMGVTTHDEAKRVDRGYETAAEKHWREIEEFIASASDDDLAELKPMAMASLNAGAQRMLKDRPVRQSKTLKGLVFKLLKQQEYDHTVRTAFD
jgi:hypothetical protein